jgi:hypothetical protein
MIDKEPTAELDSQLSSDDATPIPWAEGRERLEGAAVYWISTVRPDGRPHITPLLSVWLDGALYFCTGPDDRKAKNLVRNPHCILTTGCNALDDPAGGFGFGRHLSTLAVRREVRTQVTCDLAVLVLARIDRAASVALLLLPSHRYFSSPMARAALPACFPTSQPDFPCQSPSNARSLRATPPMLPLASRAPALDARQRRLAGILVCVRGKGKLAAHSPSSHDAVRVGRVRAGSDSGFSQPKPLSAQRAPARRGRSRVEQVILIMQE